MSLAPPRLLETPRASACGDLPSSIGLRPQQDDDTAFLAELFAAMAGPDLHAAGLPPTAVAHLVAIQFRGQSETYRAHFPDARRFILECDGQPVGRLVVDREASDLYVVDIAVSPEQQGRGIGAAAIAEVQREAAAAGLAVRALVLPHNLRSMAMFRRRGFVATDQWVGSSLELRWTADTLSG